MNSLLAYVQRYAKLIDGYVILKHPAGVYSLFFATTHQPNEFVDVDPYIKAIVSDQNDIVNMTPSEFAVLTSVLEV